ncbi:hypothetical protein Leryth_024928 [Lithospermum erythrorhizon]|nr:hypothetical protein Leryth_024928 [Lithospermum erythrorhizon]
MADMNPFDLLGDDELTEDPSQLIAAKKVSAQKPKPASQLPAKPLPPAQAVREAKPEPGQNTGRGFGVAVAGFNREPANEEKCTSKQRILRSSRCWTWNRCKKTF